MTRLLTSAVCLAIVGALALPAGAAEAKPGGLVATLAAGECTQEKAEIGKRGFRKRYGEKKPMTTCVKATRAEARRAVGVATAACQAELEDYGSEEFFYEWDSFADCVALYSDWELDGGLEDDEDPVLDDPQDGEIII